MFGKITDVGYETIAAEIDCAAIEKKISGINKILYGRFAKIVQFIPAGNLNIFLNILKKFL